MPGPYLGICPFTWHWAWWLSCCCVPWSRCDPFQVQLRRFLEDFNAALAPHGVWVKAFSFKQTNGDGHFHKDEALATLVFALSPEERQVLEMEAVLQQGHSRDPNWACWCMPCHHGRVV